MTAIFCGRESERRKSRALLSILTLYQSERPDAGPLIEALCAARSPIHCSANEQLALGRAIAIRQSFELAGFRCVFLAVFEATAKITMSAWGMAQGKHPLRRAAFALVSRRYRRNEDIFFTVRQRMPSSVAPAWKAGRIGLISFDAAM
ncbi:hypothetical protein [uncultured Pigmentiphaga sp.]|uniref:hypothetical protein n=1 Tax=uncultured Pigmentiphaga sp. TaxID=340361 RepID=UPI0026316861|nr:hypothetical protein [uncultured Pigmentiphaga sp.]